MLVQYCENNLPYVPYAREEKQFKGNKYDQIYTIAK
jgi:hypothetical protein